MSLFHHIRLLWSGRGSRHGRRREGIGINCELGDVVDYSDTGMRVLTEDRPSIQRGAVLHLQLYGGGWNTRVHARVARVQRASLQLWEIGLEFVGEPGQNQPAHAPDAQQA